MIKNNKYSYSITFLLSLIWMGGFITVVFFSSIQFNPIQKQINSKKIVYTLVPQGWAFFTRSPREAQILIYRNEKGIFKKENHTHSSVYNLLGLSRKSSVIMSEMQLVRYEIPNKLFSNTKWNYQNNYMGYIPKEIFKFKNKVDNPILCGEYLLVLQKPIPWAWSSSILEIEMKAKIIRIKIECND